jgi:hypothetical protein
VAPFGGWAHTGAVIGCDITPEARMRNNQTKVSAKPSYQSISPAFDNLELESPALPIELRLLLSLLANLSS